MRAQNSFLGLFPKHQLRTCSTQGLELGPGRCDSAGWEGVRECMVPGESPWRGFSEQKASSNLNVHPWMVETMFR